MASREYVLEVLSDQNFVRDIVKGILHTIFFQRYFPSIRPSLYTPTSATSYSSTRTQESLPVPLPAIHDPPEISAAIDSHAAALVSQLTSPGSGAPSRGEIVVQLFDRKRRKAGITSGWLGRLGGAAQTDEEVCWEQWIVQVVVARPKTETEKIKVRHAMESSLRKAAMKIVAIVNQDKDHIPPILTSEQNPFPYKILVNPNQQQNERGFGSWT